MADKPETEVLMEYLDHVKHESITLKEMAYSDLTTRYQVKWEQKVDNDFHTDFIEFQNSDEAREMFFRYIRDYVLKEKGDSIK